MPKRIPTLEERMAREPAPASRLAERRSMSSRNEVYPPELEEQQLTLPDLLCDALGVVFVGINPSIFSAIRGHYFARPTNRFWPCFSHSRLSAGARGALKVIQLKPEHDRALMDHGFGFTDLAKRATVKAADLSEAELVTGVKRLTAKLERHRPRIACFHGITGYRRVHRAITSSKSDPGLGLQPLRIGGARLFVVPNPSGANAHVTPAEQIAWYDRLAESLDSAV
jgi:double-stranded uracil-DNA glycosylase